MRREIQVRLSFGDVLYLHTLILCILHHRSRRCLRRGLRAWRIQITGGDPTWEPFTLGDWIELRRWRDWAEREHERQPEPTPWRHEAPSRPLPRPAPQEYTKLRWAPPSLGFYRRGLIWPGLSCIALGGGSFAGVLLHEGHLLPGVAVILTGAVLSTAVLRYVGKVD